MSNIILSYKFVKQLQLNCQEYVNAFFRKRLKLELISEKQWKRRINEGKNFIKLQLDIAQLNEKYTIINIVNEDLLNTYYS